MAKMEMIRESKEYKEFLKRRFDYDDRFDDLFIISSGERGKYRGSIEVGQFLVDMSKDGKVRGIEIFDASEYLKKLGYKNAKEILMNIKSVSLETDYKDKNAMIYFKINSVENVSLGIPVATVA